MVPEKGNPGAAVPGQKAPISPGMATLSVQDIRDHYQRRRVRETILRVASDGKLWRCGNGDFTRWWARDDKGYRLFDLSDEGDYKFLTGSHRTLYWSLNLFDADVRDERLEVEKSDPYSPGTVGTRRTTRAYSLGIDVDAIGSVTTADVRQAVEMAIQFICDELTSLLPNSIYAAFSGNGAYVYIHHRAIIESIKKKKIDEDEWDLFWSLITNQYNKYIQELQDRFYNLLPEHRERVKFDAVNNAKRMFKTIFSVHKRLPFVVIPMDPSNVHIDLEKATMPLSEVALLEGERWYGKWDKDISLFLKKLKPYESEVMSKLDLEPGTFSEIKIADEKIDPENFPPCIWHILKAESLPDAQIRSVALISTFLGQAGWSVDDAHDVFLERCEKLRVEPSDKFRAWFRKVACPNCSTIKVKGGAFPYLQFGDIGLCKPDKSCKGIRSPIKYAFKKAGIGAKKKGKGEEDEDVVVWRATTIDGVYMEPLREHIAVVRDETIEMVTSIEIDGVKYIPPIGESLVTEGVLTLTDSVEDPGEEKDLLNDIFEFYGAWVVLDKAGEKGKVDVSRRKLMAYYTLSTWRYERARSLPEMRVMGPPETGKSRALKVGTALSYNAVYIKSGTPAAIFRTVNMTRGTLALDEVDFSKVDPAVIDILLHRYESNSPLIRCHPITFVPEAFELYGPTFLSAYSPSENEALESRTFDIYMEESMAAPPDITDKFYKDAAALRCRLMGWRLRGLGEPAHDVNYDGLSNLTPRLRQLAGSLLACVGPSAYDFLYEFMKQRRIELVETRAAMPKGKCALAILSLLEPPLSNDQPLVSEVAYQIHVNDGLGENDKMESSKQVGLWLGDLSVRRRRTKNGYRCILDSKKILELRQRYDVEFIEDKTVQKTLSKEDKVEAG